MTDDVPRVSVLGIMTIETSAEKLTTLNPVVLAKFLKISKLEAVEQVLQTFITIVASFEVKLDPKTFIRIAKLSQDDDKDPEVFILSGPVFGCLNRVYKRLVLGTTVVSFNRERNQDPTEQPDPTIK